MWKVPERKGQTILLCDYDNCKAIDRITLFNRLRKAGVCPLRLHKRVSPGGKGLHVAIWVEGRFSRYQQVALQAILESDPEREAQNFRRAGLAGPRWKENWNVFFK